MVGTNLHIAAAYLQQGDLVAIPTETVYGLAANALNTDAVLKIFTTKQRPTFDPLIVHVASIQDLEKYVQHVPKEVYILAQHFSPGPITYILPKKKIIPDLVTSGLPLVGIRIPNHALTLELLKMLPFPLAAPSANMFGYISPTTAEHVEKGLGDKIPYILNGGKCSVGVESTIISFEHKVPSILRKGGVSIEAIEKLIGKITIADVSSSNPKAPGMLQSHYAPSKPLYLGNILENLQKYADKKPGILSFKQDYQQPIQYILSPNGHLEQAAHNLFEALRFLDDSPCECILAEKAPEQGLGKAINDRLLRASSET